MNNEITNASKPVLAAATGLRSVQSTADNQTLAATVHAVSSPAANGVNNGQNPKNPATSAEVPLSTVKTAAATGNSILQATNRNLQFQVDESSKRVVVKIVDSQNGKVLRQIPSEDMLAFIDKMQKLDGDKGSVLQDRA